MLEGLVEKGLASVEYREETVHYSGGLDGEEIEPLTWENTGFARVDRRYVRFTDELETAYRERCDDDRSVPGV